MDSILQATLFEKFTIRYGDTIITEEMSRIKKVWLLLEYLLAHRGKTVSQDKLFEILWGNEECDNPMGALKKLVYRARKVLKELDPTIGPDLIVYSNNTYSWNTGIPCLVDTDEFENSCNQAANESLTPAEQLVFCEKALQLYTGEFLPQTTYSEWVISLNTFYATLYTECVLRACSILKQLQQFDRIIKECKVALVQYPYEEKIHWCLLDAYRLTGQYNNFESHYSYITELFYKEFGASLSNEIKDIQKEIQKDVNRLELDLSVIRDGLKETEKQSGAYFCEDYEIFKNLYRVQARLMIRTGHSIHIGLMTLTDPDNQPEEQQFVNPIMDLLKNCALSNLRRGDTVAIYNPSQLVLMLPLTTFEDGKRVLARILFDFRQKNKVKNIKVQTMLRPVEPAEL